MKDEEFQTIDSPDCYITNINTETMRLAELVERTPPLREDASGIGSWANRLAEDIATSRD